MHQGFAATKSSQNLWPCLVAGARRQAHDTQILNIMMTRERMCDLPLFPMQNHSVFLSCLIIPGRVPAVQSCNLRSKRQKCRDEVLTSSFITLQEPRISDYDHDPSPHYDGGLHDRPLHRRTNADSWKTTNEISSQSCDEEQVRFCPRPST